MVEAASRVFHSFYSFSERVSLNCAEILQLRAESAPNKRAMALIRDHADILRLKEKDTPQGMSAASERDLDVGSSEAINGYHSNMIGDSHFSQTVGVLPKPRDSRKNSNGAKARVAR